MAIKKPLLGLPPKNPISMSVKKPPLACRPLIFCPTKPFNIGLEDDVFKMIQRTSEMDPEERAEYCTLVDRLQAE